MQTIFGYCRLIINLYAPGIVIVGMLTIGLIFRGKPKILLSVLIGYCALIAVFFKPSEYDDLYRYWYLIDRFRDYGWSGLQALYIGNYWYDTSYIYQVLLYGLSFLPNWSIAMLISGITYTLMGILDMRFFKENQVSPRLQGAIILLQFISIDLYSTISSWLYMLTFALIANLLYTDLVNKKKRILCMVAYLLLGQLHSVAYIIVALRFLTWLLPKRARNVSLVCILLWRLLIEGAIDVFGRFTSNPYGKRLYENAVSYSQYIENSNMIYMLGLVLFVIACLLCIRRNERENASDEAMASVNYLVKCCCMLVLGAWGSQNLMFRFSHFIMMILPLHVGTTMIRDNTHRSFSKISIEVFVYYISASVLVVYYICISYRLLL